MTEPTDVQHMISKICELTGLSPDAVQHALRTIAPTQNVPEGDTARRLYYHLKSLPESDLARMFWEALKGNAITYRLTGEVSIRNRGYGSMEITKKYTEVVTATSEQEAIELSLSSFTEEEEPVWNEGYPIITVEDAMR